jgi:hypothetical protein
MADLHREFCIFHDRVALTTGATSSLRSARDALRHRIRSFFRNTLRVETPKFHCQGSFALNTMVNPVDDRFGIDDGVYFQHLEKHDAACWPTAAAVHHWLAAATGGDITERPVGKGTCVRVRCPGRCYVDLYAYKEANGKFFMAVNGEPQWRRCEPQAFTRWFRSYVYQRGEQLLRMVRYLKAWADHQSAPRAKPVDDAILTVLAANYFRGDKRDDFALAKTVEAISDDVRPLFFVLDPVDISKELTARLTDTQKAEFKDAFREFSLHANSALVIREGQKAARLWRKQLGHRFP